MRLSDRLLAASAMALSLAAAPAVAQDAATIQRAETIRDAALNENRNGRIARPVRFIK